MTAPKECAEGEEYNKENENKKKVSSSDVKMTVSLNAKMTDRCQGAADSEKTASSESIQDKRSVENSVGERA